MEIRRFYPFAIAKSWRKGSSSILLISMLFLCQSAFSLPDASFNDAPLCRDAGKESACELEQMKKKVTQLEATLAENIASLTAKVSYLEEKKKQIDEMTQKVDFLQIVIAKLKMMQDDLPCSERITKLENEVRSLRDKSRENNFHIHVLESRVHDADVKIQELTSQVEQMGNIVNEQWIQIRHLEQALQITEMRTWKSYSTYPTGRVILKFIRNFNRDYVQKMSTVLDSKRALHHMKRCWSAAQKYHHELQYSIKELMSRNEFTAAFAHEEIVFFLASAMITFPLMSAWMLYSTCIR